MSVYIKGFKMPTCCYFCPMLEINQYSEAYCEAVGESTIIKYTYGEKPDFCPLVEVEDKELKSTNVQPVKHGHWDYYEKENGECAWYFCSECDEPAEQLYDDRPLLSEFCPHCGARMEQEKRE